MLADLLEAFLITADERHDGENRCRFLKTVRCFGGPAQAEWLSRLETEHDNLRGALDRYAADPETVEEALVMAAALGPFWRARGHLREGRERLTSLLASPQTVTPTITRADALNPAGILTMLQTDYGQAEYLHRQALEIARACGDARREADALHGIGNIRFYGQDYAEARCLLPKSYALRRRFLPLAEPCRFSSREESFKMSALGFRPQARTRGCGSCRR